MKYKNIFKLILYSMPFWWTGFSCSKLEPVIYDKADIFWQTPDQIAAGVAPAYTNLRNSIDFYSNFPVPEGSSDEFIVPTRQGDWEDNGDWAKLWEHTWGPEFPKFDSYWQYIYGGIASVNTILAAVNQLSPKPDSLVAITAELRTLRAYYYFQALDLFGNVPIQYSLQTPLDSLYTRPRAEVFSYVEKELKETLPDLSTEVNAKTYGRATRWLAQSILAKLYLNAEIYTGTARWSDCVAACDDILNSGYYSLQPDYFTNFKINNDVNPSEIIFAIPFDINAGLGYFYLQSFTLHYYSPATFGLEARTCANGPCFPGAFFHLFDAGDLRKNMFIVGQQYVDQTVSAANFQYDVDVNLPLNFDPDITVFSSQDPKQRMAGARCGKFEFNKTGGGLMSNDFPVYRLSDIILMKGEAQYRNGDKAGALATINQKINGISIRSRATMPDFGNELNLDTLCNERGRELAWEGHRRTDLIRFGHFTDARVPDKAVSESFRTLYPIPNAELGKNSGLKQNPGY